MSDNHLDYQNFLNYLKSKLLEEMKCRNFTQQDLVKYCAQNGLSVSQSTISSIITGNKPVALHTYLDIFNILGIRVFAPQSASNSHDTVPSSIGQIIDQLFTLTSYSICTNPTDRYFNGLLGDYFCYFYSTNKNEQKLLEGKLSFSAMNGFCKASLLLKNSEDENTFFAKYYDGFLVVSPILSAAYCLLVEPEIGEISYFSFWHKPILNKRTNLGCRMASVSTISSGVDERLTTLHRLFFCRRQLNESEKRYIGGQLHLNKSRIVLSESQYQAMCKDPSISEEFLHLFDQVSTKETYYCLTESTLLPDKQDKRKYFSDLCILREYSEAPLNNKIRVQTDSDIFHNLYKRKI